MLLKFLAAFPQTLDPHHGSAPTADFLLLHLNLFLHALFMQIVLAIPLSLPLLQSTHSHRGSLFFN